MGAGSSGSGYSALSAIVPYSVASVANQAGLGKGGGIDAAVMVPALVGLAALMLATTAVLRRRRLASRPGLG